MHKGDSILSRRQRDTSESLRKLLTKWICVYNMNSGIDPEAGGDRSKVFFSFFNKVIAIIGTTKNENLN